MKLEDIDTFIENSFGFIRTDQLRISAEINGIYRRCYIKSGSDKLIHLCYMKDGEFTLRLGTLSGSLLVLYETANYPFFQLNLDNVIKVNNPEDMAYFL